MSTTYSLAQSGAEDAERERLHILEQVCDPLTARMLDAIDVEKGWRCLDVGAGAGSVTTMLAERVGPQGSVMAVDLDIRLLEHLASDVVEVRSHDILAEPLGSDFDLVHARNLVMHLPARQHALSCLATPLRSGGVLAVGDWTVTDVRLNGRSPQWERAFSAILDVLVSVGWDPSYGRRLTADLEALGLAEVRSEQYHPYERGGSLCAHMLIGTTQRLRGLASADPADIDEMIRLLLDPATGFDGPTVTMAWGRRK